MLGIVSDTHGCKNTFVSIIETYFKEAELLIHAGDVLYHGPRNPIPKDYNPKELAMYMNRLNIPTVIAKGNCDAEVDEMVLDMPIQNPYAIIIYNRLRIVVNHGHSFNFAEKLEIAKKFKANIFISGHTHVPELIKTENIVFVNPGSPGLSKHPENLATAARIVDANVEVFDIATGKIIMSESIL